MEDFLAALIRGFGVGSTYALLAVGFVIIYRGTQVINFAQPALMILGAYATSAYVTAAGLPFWLAVVLGMLTLALVGAIAERIALRPMVGRPAFTAATVTVGVFIILLAIAGRLIGTDIVNVGDPWGLDTVEVLGATVYVVDLAKITISLLTIAGVGLFLVRSRVGLAMRATALDQEVALAQGIDVGRMFSLSWAMAAALASLAGVLISSGATGVDASIAFVALRALPVIILGGLDSVKGAVVGGLLIGVAESLTRAYQPVYAPWLGANFDLIVPYLIMIGVLMIRPYGLFGTKEVQRV